MRTGAVVTRFRAMDVSETFLIDRNGVVADRSVGKFEPVAPRPF